MENKSEYYALDDMPLNDMPYLAHLNHIDDLAKEAYPDTYDINRHMRTAYKMGYEQARKDFVEQAINWLKKRLDNVLLAPINEFIKQFRNEMEIWRRY